MSENLAVCPVCFRHCRLKEGERGFCGARKAKGGKVVCDAYGRLTALALDPIEKKPFARFRPGTFVVSVGSYGCNLTCPFCQNYEISRKKNSLGTTYVSPEKLLAIVAKANHEDRRTIGAAYTYNEPMTFYEYIRDAAKLLHEAGFSNVVVTNGTAELGPLEEILPYVDAMNIDLKASDPWTYEKVLGGNLEETKAFIKRAAASCHVEITTLLVPGINDTEEDVRKIAAFVRDVDGKGEIPLHLSRFFPRYQMEHTPATDVAFIYRMRDAAAEELRYVYTGNC